VAKYLQVSTWARRELFEFFRNYDNPYFNICARVDVSGLLEFLRDRPGVSVTLAYHYFALRVANEIEPFRYRLRNEGVVIHDVIHGGTTVLLPNESFSFAYFNYDVDFEKFIEAAQRAVKIVASGSAPFTPKGHDDVVHFTTLPWVSFTSFAHARDREPLDSIPKIAFGKFSKEGDRQLLPISVEVHHALMDGISVGRYLTQLEAALAEPQTYLKI
jgi:chloramphenicol O-acetyltransferase type A